MQKNLKNFLLFSILSLFVIAFTHTAYADVWTKDSQNYSGVFIPENEFMGYYASDGFYTVIGNIKNFEDFTIIPTVTINIQDGDKEISKSFEYASISSSKELPFKIKFPEVTSNSPILKNPNLSYHYTKARSIDVEVIYDETLVTHEDGHLTGRVINNGESPVYNLKIFAIVHGHKEILDMTQNVEMIDKIEPGEIKSFSMYPDPLVASQVYYYSCFAPSDTSIVPLSTTRNNEKFFFRYDSGSWYYAAQFNDDNTELQMKTQTSFSLPTYANFEFPYYTDNENFEVFLNNEPKKSIQSIDEMGNIHVAFNVEPRETGQIKITGFDKDWKPKQKTVPDWVRFNAAWWAVDVISDGEFASAIEFLIKEGIIEIQITNVNEQIDDSTIPGWIKKNAEWWSKDIISERDFLSGIQYLITNGIITV